MLLRREWELRSLATTTFWRGWLSSQGPFLTDTKWVVVNFRRTAVGARMAKLDSLWSDGVFLGYRSISGEIVVGTESGVFKTRTVQRKAYERRWNKENMDMVGGVPWKASPSEDSEEGIMLAVDIGMEMPEVEIPRAPKEDRRPVPRRLYIRAKDIDRHGVTPNCKGCIATLRGEGGVSR